MELPLLSSTGFRFGFCSSSPSSSSSWCGGSSSSCSSSKLFDFQASSSFSLWRRSRLRNILCFGGNEIERSRCVKASSAGQSSGEVIDDGDGGAVHGLAGPAGEVTSVGGFGGGSAVDFTVWDKIGAVVRLSYGMGIYCGMAVAGRLICDIAGIDSMGGLDPSLDAILAGLGYASPPIMALLFILDDEVVKLSPHARAIRDVEDEELRNFFYGMSAWQFILLVAASSVGEELFYRAAIQGALSDIFVRGTNLISDSRGMVSLTGIFPPFVPFAQAFAAAVTAALTGSLYYVAASPKDPTYIMAPVLKSRSGHDELKKLFAGSLKYKQQINCGICFTANTKMLFLLVFAAWYERRQMKKIYSPLLEGLLALYLGFEWIQTNNILAPIITHGIYSAVVLGNGLWKIHYHRQRLRQRVQQLEKRR